MEYFLQQHINGVTLGSIYGLIAIGCTMVYGIIGMINFAHGDVFMVGGFVSLIAIVALGLTGGSGLFLILLALMLVGFFSAIIPRTQLGRAQRSCEQDMKMASLLGIDVDRTISITFIMGAVLAAVA